MFQTTNQIWSYGMISGMIYGICMICDIYVYVYIRMIYDICYDI